MNTDVHACNNTPLRTSRHTLKYRLITCMQLFTFTLIARQVLIKDDETRANLRRQSDRHLNKFSRTCTHRRTRTHTHTHTPTHTHTHTNTTYSLEFCDVMTA